MAALKSLPNDRLLPSLGGWSPIEEAAWFSPTDLVEQTRRIREPVHVVQQVNNGAVGIAYGGEVQPSPTAQGSYRWLATLPPLYPEWLGDRAFLEAHGVRFPYVSGEMANGIATSRMVVAIARHGMLGFFGAAGMSPERVDRAIDEMETGCDGRPFGVNLIHSPGDPRAEHAMVDLYLRRNVTRMSASAFMNMTESVVRYACTGLREDESSRVIRKNRVFAKISREEVAREFMSPAPEPILRNLRKRGLLTAQEVQLAQRVAIAEDVTVEADSGGHTDNRPLVALLPTIFQLRNELTEAFGYTDSIRVGVGGGLGTPASVAAAFALGAAYVLTGSINQSAVESGLSATGKKLLCQADLTDVTMAPAADMFELGVKVQVLKKGTLFSSRASRLYQIYNTYASLEEIPAKVRQRVERDIFRRPLDEVWQETEQYFARRDPEQVVRANQNAKLKMALVFRWYLGNASRWAIGGTADRVMDYQIWCGPAMGAFNAWARHSFLEDPQNRTVGAIALNLLEGAAVITRAQQLRAYGVPMPAQAFHYAPRRLRVLTAAGRDADERS